MTKDRLLKIRTLSPLCVGVEGDVIRELLAEIDRLQSLTENKIDSAKKETAKPVAWRSYVEGSDESNWGWWDYEDDQPSDDSYEPLFVEPPGLAEDYSEVLRFLACYVGCGGYNAPDPINAKAFEGKIKYGIDLLIGAKNEH